MKSEKLAAKEFELNKVKALNALLFVCNQLGGSSDMYTLLKIIFFADSKHLFNYGRPITGDVMYSMQFGPVPSFCYDSVKLGSFNKEYFSTTEENIVQAKKESDLNVFSESDIECLKDSIKENAYLGFSALRDKSHTQAYEKIKGLKGLNKPIPYLEIAKMDGHVDEEMLNYICSRFEY